MTPKKKTVRIRQHFSEPLITLMKMVTRWRAIIAKDTSIVGYFLLHVWVHDTNQIAYKAIQHHCALRVHDFIPVSPDMCSFSIPFEAFVGKIFMCLFQYKRVNLIALRKTINS